MKIITTVFSNFSFSHEKNFIPGQCIDLGNINTVSKQYQEEE